MERTLVLLKPDALHRRLVGDLVARFERKGLTLVGLKMVHASKELAEKHYAVHAARPFYQSLIGFLTSGPTVAIVLEGREAVAAVRGATTRVETVRFVLFDQTVLEYFRRALEDA